MDIKINEWVFDGKHETTDAILHLMSKTDFQGKDVIDIGCGSGILTVYASELGAKHITALDIDSRAVDNTRENCVRNGITNAEAYWLDFMQTDLKADILLANLPRESILMCLPKMCDSLNDDGIIIASWYKQNPTDILDKLDVIECVVGNDYDCYILKRKENQ